MNKLRWRIYIIWLSVKWCFRINLGDLVWYRDKRYVVTNGVRSGMWCLSEWDIFGNAIRFKNDFDGWVYRTECIKIKTISNFYNSFKSGYRFYMTSWYDIWVHNGIKDWMKSCHIWPGNE